MMFCRPKRNRRKSLTAQISDAERQVSRRQREVGVCAATLLRNIQQQMTAPASLLLAGGFGFVIGELTTHAPRGDGGAAETPGVAETTALRTALNVIASAHALYMALPLAWLMKPPRQPNTSGQAH